MEKRIQLFIFCLFIFNSIFSQNSERHRISAILEKIQENAKKFSTLQYEANVNSTRPGEDDSISNFSGKIWLKIDKMDTIFGFKLHIKGQDKGGDYDYYYDGTKSYEMHHAAKKLLITDPYAFPNNLRNPVKTRTSLSPLLYLLTDDHISTTLLKDNPVQHLKESDYQWIIQFDYPKDNFGQIVSKEIIVLKQTFQIIQLTTHINWNGTEYINKHTISNYMSDKRVDDELAFSSVFDKYEVELKPGNISKIQPIQFSGNYASLIGKPAPDFEYSTFLKNSNVNLISLKGKYVLLDFWETWCGYCILSIPKKNELFNRYPSSDFLMIGISTENRKLVQKILESNNVKYPNLMADKKVLESYGVDARPLYVLIDRDGKIISASAGNLDKVIELVENSIKK